MVILKINQSFQIQIFHPVLMCLIFLIVINAVKEAILPSSKWTNFDIDTTEVMVAYTISL